MRAAYFQVWFVGKVQAHSGQLHASGAEDFGQLSSRELFSEYAEN